MTYSQSTWRNAAAPITARVIRKVGTDDVRALRQALREAYPWGERKMHPYRIWCDEIRRQLADPPLTGTRRAPAVAPGQLAIPTDGEHLTPAAADPATMAESAASPEAPLNSIS